jgi:hypothetical protein
VVRSAGIGKMPRPLQVRIERPACRALDRRGGATTLQLGGASFDCSRLNGARAQDEA